jgi:peptidoglycan/LPS O-acetylase OafA/YrhL
MPLLRYLASPWLDVNSRQSSHGDSVAVLDGIRGLAVLLVVASHTGAFGVLGQGSVGVFLFFTLSGFVLTLPFADNPKRLFQSGELWHYFANRALRIIPAYVVAVLLIAWFTNRAWQWIWPNLSFYAGWNHLWSVAEEVRFYILFPAVAALLSLLPSRIWRMVALALMTVLAWYLRDLHHIDIMMDGIAVEFYFYFFLAGMLTCLIYRALGRRSVNIFHSVNAITVIAGLALYYLNGWVYPEVWCVLFILLLAGMTNSQNALVSRMLRSWFMRHIGLLSYSLYLYHFSISVWLWTFGLRETWLFAATFAVTYAISIASYLAVEKPFLMLKPKRHTPRL